MTAPEKLNIIAIIPARSGSKSIPDKNIQSIAGKPLIAYSIEHALASKYIQRVIVSTDSQYYADVSASFKAEVPFLRPKVLAGDFSTDFDVFEHALTFLKENENYTADIVVHLRPTTPLRDVADIDAMIELMIQNPEADSIRSLAVNKEPVYKIWFQGEGNYIHPAVTDPQYPEAYNMPRQVLPVSYLQNASIDIKRSATVLEKKSMTGEKIMGFVMNSNYDIDYHEQMSSLPLATIASQKKNTFVFDIDGVVAYLSPNNDYGQALPNTEIINKINELYHSGHTIVLFTARGSKTGIDWQAITENQMRAWGVKYHQLSFGKPFADYYIDDRMLSINDVLNFKTTTNDKI